MHYEVGTWTGIFPMVLNRRKPTRRHNYKGTKPNRFISNPKQRVNPEFWSGSTDPFGRRRRWNQRIWSRGSINTDGEDLTTWLQVGAVSNEDGVESESAEDEGTVAAWDDIEVCIAPEQDQEHGLGQRREKQLEQKHSMNLQHPFW